jgi:glycerophosphoryl diester phosphodiesterase
MEDLAQQGVPVLAPALWKMLALNGDQKIVPSEYAINAKAVGLDLIA